MLPDEYEPQQKGKDKVFVRMPDLKFFFSGALKRDEIRIIVK